MTAVAPSPSRLRRRLLAWYDAKGRTLPWRVRDGRKDPYRVWLSEIMLQQTTTPHAAPYFAAFTRRWPDVAALAVADDAEVMAAWAGLGYYARARNMLACARAVVRDHGSRFPQTEDELRALPGVGDYTAAAVAAIGFGRPANVVDGNVERVIARLYAVEAPLPAAKPALRALAAGLVTHDRPGDWAQALMDLGATLCRPRSPECERCPLSSDCRARASGDPAAWPRRTPRAERPGRHGQAFVHRRGEAVALVTRPPRGLLGGALGLPATAFTPAPHAEPDPALWREAGVVRHVFTHFELRLDVFAGDAPSPEGAIWLALDEARRRTPTLFRKALDLLV